LLIRGNFPPIGFISVTAQFPSGIIRDGHIDLKTYDELVKTQDYDYKKDLLLFNETDGSFKVINRSGYNDEIISNYYE